jgi:excisionase family DNA binding protein
MQRPSNDVPTSPGKIGAGERQSLFETWEIEGSSAGPVPINRAVRARPGQKDTCRPRPDAANQGEPVFLLSIQQAARSLGHGRSKMYELIAAGDLEVVHIGRATRVPVDAVERFVERLRAG